MKLSAITLTPAMARLDHRDLHKKVEGSLGRARPADATRALWARPHPGLLIVRGWRTPDHAWWDDSRITSRDWTPCTGPEVEVSVIASPQKRRSIKREDGTRSHIHQGQVDDLPGWLQARIPSVRFDTVRFEPLPTVWAQNGPNRVRVPMVGFHATATVVDMAGFVRAQVDGVGRARAYGAGLLLATEAPR